MTTPIVSGYMIIKSKNSERPVTWIQVHRILNSNDFTVLHSLLNGELEDTDSIIQFFRRTHVRYTTDEVAEQVSLFRTVLDQHDLMVHDCILNMKDKNGNVLFINDND